MMTASKCGVRIKLESLPILKGSLNTLRGMGIKSTLHDGNRLVASRIKESSHEKFELLFDPQTSGGLLGSLPASSAEACVSELRQAGYHDATAIGIVTKEEEFDLY